MTDKTDRSLFDSPRDADSIPLAERMRPLDLDNFEGQEHITGEGRFLSRVADSGKVPSLILWGPPGSGKTTIARLIAGVTSSEFVSFSAVLSGVKEVREIIETAGQRRKFESRGTVLFVDEIHRFNKAQQDAFLPHVEDGTVTLIGATTENPSFEIIPPLLSRCQVITLERLEDADIGRIIDRAIEDTDNGLGKLDISIDPDARSLIIEASGGDARKALNALETSAGFAGGSGTITAADAAEAIKSPYLKHDKGGEDHYNVISAFIKSLRGSNPDAALYWLARLIEAGEDPRFVARRMIIFASEDVSNAEPAALMIANAAAEAVDRIGMPEAAINLAHATTYLACAPKSNASYVGLEMAGREVRKSGALDVPTHLRNAPTKLMSEMGYGKDYKYPHDFDGGVVDQEYLPDKIAGKKFYFPTEIGREKNIADRLKDIREKIAVKSKPGPKSNKRK